jgi:hypothetical protein
MKNAKCPSCRAARVPDIAVQGRTQDEAGKPTSRRKLKLAKFPRFEDVTPEEAHSIAKGAPRSGRFRREHSYSLIGSAAALCELETK